ncbi:T6SS immunity protein Tli4 family protein [Niveibacterium sp. SC-1]|uniref:T6SS immunity protein Tli4 family protein n=1 Tax=Niveibacterium sp. SC-1 TaxID=3135646 RepID=UPI00311E48AF
MTKRRHMAIFCRCLQALLALSVIGCHAREVPESWKTDCVGRMQLSLPGDAEIAANSVKMLEAEYRVGSTQPRFEFADGEIAGWSAQHYMGRLFVSHQLMKRDISTLDRAASKYVEQSRKWAVRTKVSSSGEKLAFEMLRVEPHKGIGSRVSAAYTVSLFIEDRLIRLSSSGRDMTWAEQGKELNMFLTGVVARPFGSIPNKPGVCLPYFFVTDDGKPQRSIGMTYRLRDHPDVSVWLEDASALKGGDDRIEAKLEPRAKSDFFWSNYRTSDRILLRSEWRTPYRDISLAGTRGVESFVKIVRKDGTADYGYLAAGRGNPDEKGDTPDLMLYVIQDARIAKDKGVEPLGKDALLDIAQRIAASVKRRATAVQQTLD